MTVIRWEDIPIEAVPVSRFVICLAGITPTTLAEPARDEPVEAMTRCGHGIGDVWPYNGRHRVLRALLDGDETVPTRLLHIP